jgi:hypothetical protein
MQGLRPKSGSKRHSVEVPARTEIEDDPGVRAVILTGACDRAFSAGADIHEFSLSVAAGPQPAVKAFVRRGQAMTARIEAFPKPITAAVNGLAFGGGCETVEAVHLAVSSEQASFCQAGSQHRYPAASLPLTARLFTQVSLVCGEPSKHPMPAVELARALRASCILLHHKVSL